MNDADEISPLLTLCALKHGRCRPISPPAKIKTELLIHTICSSIRSVTQGPSLTEQPPPHLISLQGKFNFLKRLLL